MKSLFFSFSLLATLTMCAQESSTPTDEQLIKETIGHYFEGWLTSDTSKIGMAMHSTCHLKFIKDGNLTMFTRSEYLGLFKSGPNPPRENSAGSIATLNITRTAAAAKCVIDTPKREYTDYFNLLKVNGRWYITDKISSSIAK